MLRIVLIVLGVLAAIVLLLVVVVAMQPSDFRITRSAIINAPAVAVFEQVNDLHKWEAWSPWEKLDPNMKRTYGGQPAGVGASYSWSGDDNVGEGTTTIAANRPSESVQIKLEFVRPFACSNDVEFTFVPEGEQTKVTWSMTGQNGFMAKAFGLICDMDKMVGGQFEEGLANLKKVAEAAPAPTEPTPVGPAIVPVLD